MVMVIVTGWKYGIFVSEITVMIKVVYEILQIIFNSATTHWFQKEKFAAR